MNNQQIKVGDRCIVISSMYGNEGKIVRVVDDLGVIPRYTQIMYRSQRWTATGDYAVGIISEGSPLTVPVYGKVMYMPVKRLNLRRLPDLKEDIPQLEQSEH